MADIARRSTLAERLLAVAESDGDSGRLLEAHHSVWATMGAMGEAVRAIPHCERGIALYDPARHASQAFVYGGHDAGRLLPEPSRARPLVPRLSGARGRPPSGMRSVSRRSSRTR